MVDGFLFATAEEFKAQARQLRNDIAQPVEEFEISFIYGDEIDCALADA